MTSNPLINPRDAAYLESRNLLGPVSRNRRQVARSSALSSEATTTSLSSSDSGYGSDESLIIPVNLISEETLVCLGFQQGRASEIWTRFRELNLDEDGEMELIDLAMSTIESQPRDAWGNLDDWRAVLTSFGISEELQAKMMSDEVKEVRLTGSAKFWTLEAIQARYLALEQIQQKSIIRAAQLDSTGDSSGTSGDMMLAEGSRDQGGGNVGHQGASSGSGGTKSGRGGNEPTAKIARRGSSSNKIPGTITLWKGIAECRLKRNSSTNEILFESLVSGQGPNDLRSSGGTSYYFSPQKIVAEMYAKMAAKMNHYSNVKVIMIQVPNDLIEKIPPLVLKFEDTFKRVIYRSRGQVKLLTDEYKDLKYIHSAALVIAPICKSHNRAIGKLTGWQEISEANLLTFPKPGDSAQQIRGIQYVFQGDEIQWKLMDAVHLEEFGLGDAQELE